MSSELTGEIKRIRWWAVELLRKRKYKHATILALHCYKQSFIRSHTTELLENVLLLGKCLYKQHMFREALRCAQDAEAYANSDDISGEVECDAMRAIGSLYIDVGQYSRANWCFQQHYLLTEAIHGPDHVRCSDAHSIVSGLLAKQGKFEEALRHGMKALTIREQHFGINSTHTISSHYNVGLLYRSLDLLENARQHFCIAIEARKNLFGMYSLPVAEVEMSLAFTQEQRGHIKNAIDRYYKAFRIRKKILGMSHEHTKAAQKMLLAAKARLKSEPCKTPPPSENKLLSAAIVKNLLDRIKNRLHIKNIARRCHALNPYLQAELVYATGISKMSKTLIAKRFYKHQDLLRELFEDIASNGCTSIDSSHMYQCINIFLDKVTEKLHITSKIEKEIISACPLSMLQLKRLLGQDTNPTSAITEILNNVPEEVIEQNNSKVIDSEFFAQRILVAVCKINAKKIAHGKMPVISVKWTEKLLIMAYKFGLDTTEIARITSPNVKIGEAILEQLSIDNRRISHLQNIYQAGMRRFISPCCVFVAITLMRELHPNCMVQESVVMALLKAARNRSLCLNDVSTLMTICREDIDEYFIPLLKAATFCEMKASFKKRGDFFLSEFESKTESLKLMPDIIAPTLPLQNRKETIVLAPELLLRPTSEFANRDLCQTIYATAKINNVHLSQQIIDDVTSGTVCTLNLLKNKIHSGYYGTGKFEPLLRINETEAIEKPPVQGGNQIFKIDSQAWKMHNTTRDVIDDFPGDNKTTLIQLEYFDRLKSKYPHLSGAIDEIAADLVFERNSSNGIMYKKEMSLSMINNKMKRDGAGRRLKEVQVSSCELWKICVNKIIVLGIMSKKVKGHRFLKIAAKLMHFGCFLKAKWLHMMQKQSGLLVFLGLFKFLCKEKHNSSRLSIEELRKTAKFGNRLLNKTKYKGPKLRGVHWATLDEANTKGTIWEGRKRTFSTVSHIFQDVEDVFAPGSIKKIGSLKNEIKKKTRVISLLSPKRTQNIGITLARVWRGSFTELARAVTLLKSSIIGVDNLEQLSKIAPTPDEIEILKSYTGDTALLNKADQFVQAMATITRCRERLDAMIFHEKFKETIVSMVDAVGVITRASNEILESHNFQELLGIVLSLGNKLNQNTRKQLAAGIRIDGLMKLATTKGKTGVTVLEYMVKHLQSSKPEILEVGQELQHLKAATVPNYSALTTDMKTMQRGLENIQNQMTVDEKEGEVTFKNELGLFYKEAKIELENANNAFLEMKTKYARAAQWLFEDPKTTEPAKLFSRILQFISAVDSTKVKMQDKHNRMMKTGKSAAKKTREDQKPVANKSKQLLDIASKRTTTKRLHRNSIDSWKDEIDG
eukprot:g2066.t1